MYQFPFSFLSVLSAYQESSLLIADPQIMKGLSWVWSQRDLSYGFSDVTAKAVTTFQLSSAKNWFTSENVDSTLAVKQLDIELLVQLSRLV